MGGGGGGGSGKKNYAMGPWLPLSNLHKKHPWIFKYVTFIFNWIPDTDMQIPGISAELKARLMSSAQSMGMSVERRLENVGLCSSQVVLQLLDKQRR